MTIMKGDALTVRFDLLQGDTALTPAEVSDLEVCVGSGKLRFLLSEGTLRWDGEKALWGFRLTQEDTFAMAAIDHTVTARVKYPGLPDFDVRGVELGKIAVRSGQSREVL